MITRRTLVATALLTLSACALFGRTAVEGVTKINGPRARELVSQGAVLLDVRSESEYRDAHIDGALNVPYDQVAQRTAEIGPKERPVVLYCRSGRRSAIAGKTLIDAGFTNVYDLGSKSDW
jgi:phage shock protein E